MLPGHAPTQNSAATGGNTAHTTSPPNHLKRERQEELGFVENGASAKRRDTGEGKALSPPGFASGPKNHHHQGQMMPPPSIPVSNPGGANAISVRVTSPPANGPLTFSLPMPSGTPSMGQHQAQQHGQQHGNEQKRQPSVPPPAPTRTPTPRTPSAGASHLSPPLARHPSLPPTPTTTSPPRSSVSSSQQHLHFASSNHAANSSGQPNNASNPSMTSNTMPSSSAPSDMPNLPNFGINATEAQIAAMNRERMRQMQIKAAQQQAHAQHMRLGGATGHGANMGMGMGGTGMGGTGMGGNVGLGGIIPVNSTGSGGGIAAGGMGMSGMGMGIGMGDMMPPGANPRMMPQQHQSHTGGMEAANAMSPPNMNANVNQLVGPSGMAMGTGMGGMQVPAGMGRGMNMSGMGSMSQGTAGGMGGQGAMGSGVGGPVQGAASQQQALFQQLHAVLRNPNHPMMKFMLQNVPEFERMPTNMKLMNARVCHRFLLSTPFCPVPIVPLEYIHAATTTRRSASCWSNEPDSRNETALAEHYAAIPSATHEHVWYGWRYGFRDGTKWDGQRHEWTKWECRNGWGWGWNECEYDGSAKSANKCRCIVACSVSVRSSEYDGYGRYGCRNGPTNECKYGCFYWPDCSTAEYVPRATAAKNGKWHARWWFWRYGRCTVQ